MDFPGYTCRVGCDMGPCQPSLCKPHLEMIDSSVFFLLYFAQFVYSFVQVGLDPVEIALRKGVRSQNQQNCFENCRRFGKFAVLKVCHFNFDHVCIFTG